MFDWFNRFGFESIIIFLRHLYFMQIKLPSWIIFNLPDAIWIFSFTNLMLIIWNDKFSWQSAPWIIAAPIIGLGLEFGQAFHIVKGTFDIIDILFIMIASTIPLLISIKQIKIKHHEKLKS
jgi:hypothetical protein